MCTIFISFHSHDNYPLIVLSNRDEFYERPTVPAHWWKNADILAGQDQREQGTWLGITSAGCFATVTNYRESDSKPDGMKSRGLMVRDFLQHNDDIRTFLDNLTSELDNYNGFNLIAGTLEELYYLSNRAPRMVKLEPGIHALSNGLLNEPWFKVERGMVQFLELIQDPGAFDGDKAFQIMQDRTRAPEKRLPDTGFPPEAELFLSSLFIEGDNYGTRCTTLLTIDNDGLVSFEERNHVADKSVNTYSFQL